MMKTKQMLAMAGVAIVMSLSTASLLAQNNDNNNNNNNNGGQGRHRGPGGGRGNFDPAQFRQRMIDNCKEQLEITDDTEWKAIQPLIEKVVEARFASFSGMGRGMFGGRPRGGGDNGGGASTDQNQRRGPSNPEAEALQKAIDGKAPNSELKAATAKFVAARKTKQAQLEKAQADLRKVLSVRQEAIATESGLL